MNYENPILRGMYPDPSVVRVGDTYYLATSTFEYYPGIALSKSTDLLNWEKIPSVATTLAQADLSQAKSNEGIFAVCLRYHAEHFYAITTNFAEFKTFFIKGTLTKTGIQWEENRTEIAVRGIDPDLYFEDGRCYVQFTGYVDDKGNKAIQQVEISVETGAILQGPEILTFGSGGRDVEAPHILKKDDWYYLLMAEGGTGVGHMITMFRSRNLWGPYDAPANVNPLFTNRDRAEKPLQNIGHGDLFQDILGNWWLTCLGTRPATVGFTQITNIGRETLLYPVKWSGDWPQIYTGVPEQTVDMTDFPEHAKILTVAQTLTPFVDDFMEKNLQPEWITLRGSLQEKLQVTPSSLSLTGSTTTLSDTGTPSFLGVRQTEHEEDFRVILDREQTQIRAGKLGVACLINNDHYATLLIEKVTEGYRLVRFQKVADLEVHEVLGTLADKPESMGITHHTAKKRFWAYGDGQEFGFDTAALHFSNEAIAALNTGDFQGMYVLGDALMSVKEVRRTQISCS